MGAPIEQWESILFKLNGSKRYRRTVGSIAGSCLTAATPLLSSLKHTACLVALDIVEVHFWPISETNAVIHHAITSLVVLNFHFPYSC